MIPVTGSGRIPLETAFFPTLSCRFPHTSGRIRPEKAPEDGSSIPTGTSSYAETRKSGKFPLPDSIRKQEGSERETSRKSTFPFGTWGKSSYCSRMSAKNYRFPRDADKIIQCFLDHGKTNKKSLLKISVRLSFF